MRRNQTHIRLRLLLENRFLTQKDFAELTGLTESAVCKYLQGEREPNAPSLIKIAEATGVSPNWILGYGSDDHMELLKED